MQTDEVDWVTLGQVYVAVALTVVPRGSRASAVLVHSRIGLALGGVSCVAAAVVAALGAQPHFRLAATLRSSLHIVFQHS